MIVLRIRRMRTGDIPFAIRLSDQENWGITRGDLKRLLHITPSGGFIACEGTERVGLATATMYGNTLAWIGNVIVDRQHRGKRIGHALVEHAVTFLERSRVRHIALYCFREHLRFYRSLGFVRDVQFVRMRRRARAHEASATLDRSSRDPSLSELLRADRIVFGADRSRLLRSVLANRAGWYTGSAQGRLRLSYLFVREYRDMCEIGPWVCINPQRGEPESMLREVLRKVGKLPLETSCLRMNARALPLMKRAGFQTVQEGYRMFFGDRARIGNDRAQYALGFLDKG